MYKIISISNKPHTVVYVCNHLSLPLFQSYDYAKILKFINKLFKEQCEDALRNVNRITDNLS